MDTAKVVDRNRPHRFVGATAGCSAARLAHLLWEQGVGGSNPLTPTSEKFIRCGRLAQLGERLLYTQVVGGSSPLAPTILL